ncbi:hypothetical protein PoB_002031400 [Plakobranchus ocellatus]|uniref:Uncharacterized protein n=1 Tax=Plakobranchus ocellatus TaxID=259542 RepID=A0AAV3ZEK1_9GAST|nr:hypothetical protein PoB_002031400 [Plakobranchus ocellatus]
MYLYEFMSQDLHSSSSRSKCPNAFSTVNPRGYGLNRQQISLTGKYRVGEEFRSKLDLTWVSPDSGYCMVYKCVATGRDPNNGKLLAVYQTLQVDAADGGSCP